MTSFLPPRPSHPLFLRLKEPRHDRYVPRRRRPARRDAQPLRRRAPSLLRHRAHGLPHRRRPVRDASHPSLAHPPLRRHAGRHGLRRQCQHHGHGGGRASRSAISAARSTGGWASSISLVVLAIPTALLAHCAGPHGLHPSARGAGAVHGGRLHAHAGLSRRALQRRRFGERLCRLHHRQRREQSDRAADLGGRRRPFRARRQFLFLRRAQSARRGAGLFHRREDAADDRHGATA